MNRLITISIPAVLAVLVACTGPAEPVVTADFPGGNIIVLEQGEDTIKLQPDLSETEGEWFYWYYKIRNISDRTLTFKFMMNNQFTAAGPSCSLNNNREWNWLGGDKVNDNAFTYTFAKDDTVAYFSMAIPYTQANYDEFLEQLGDHPFLRKDTLALSHEGRAIERLWLLPESGEPESRILLTVRHHACEMMASYVLEGLIESVVNEPSLESLRSDVEFMIIPFVDKDGVENGEQGKNRLPRDHNRDYDGKSIYASTAALRDKVPFWADGKLRIALDLHCPWIKGENNEWIYLVGKSDPEIEEQQKYFSSILEKNTTGVLKFKSENFLPFGVAWNTDNNNTKGMSFSHWAADLEGIRLSTTLEFPYGMILGEEVSPEKAREFGHALALSIRDYLEEIK